MFDLVCCFFGIGGFDCFVIEVNLILFVCEDIVMVLIFDLLIIGEIDKCSWFELYEVGYY